jgi:predicted ATPase with chaperone activity
MLHDLKSDPQLVDAYAEYSLSQEKFAWRATWVIDHYSKINPAQLQKYAVKYIESVKELKSDGHIRETLKILYNLDLDESQTSEVFEICYKLMQNNKLQSSVRVSAFHFMMKVAEQYPDLKEEIKIIFENIKDYLSPGIRNGMEIRLKKVTLTK